MYSYCDAEAQAFLSQVASKIRSLRYSSISEFKDDLQSFQQTVYSRLGANKKKSMQAHRENVFDEHSVLFAARQQSIGILGANAEIIMRDLRVPHDSFTAFPEDGVMSGHFQGAVQTIMKYRNNGLVLSHLLNSIFEHGGDTLKQLKLLLFLFLLLLLLLLLSLRVLCV